MLEDFSPLIVSSYCSQRTTRELYAMATIKLALTDPFIFPLAVHQGWNHSCFFLQALAFGARAWSRRMVLN